MNLSERSPACGVVRYVKRKEEYEGRIKQELGVLNEVSNDTTMPRNIRGAAKSAMGALEVGDKYRRPRRERNLHLS